MKMTLLIFAFLFLPAGFLSAQGGEDGLYSDSTMGIIDTSIVNRYKFINYRENKFQFFADTNKGFERFYEKFDSLINFRRGQIIIYHIGGSHIQADVYSNRMRTWLNTYWPGLKGARGLVFPYTLAETNNPWNYRIDATGNWIGHRCVVKKDTSVFGIQGISASTKDSIAGFKIFYREKEPMKYQHSRIKIYHNIHNKSFDVSFGYPEMVERIVTDSIAGYTQFFLNKMTDTVFIKIKRIVSDTSSFFVYGVEMMNDLPGVVYNSIGVNGAAFPNYLRCEDFEKQLAQLPPDMFFISIGTNDANVLADDFKPEAFKANYEEMIKKILRVNPNAAIVLTVPNDAYYYRKYANKNVAKIRDVIYELSAQYHCGVWDFYGIMGDFGSSQTWYKADLMHKDRIHFTYDGYILKGDLFFEAFLKFLDDFEYRRLVKLSNRD